MMIFVTGDFIRLLNLRSGFESSRLCAL